MKPNKLERPIHSRNKAISGNGPTRIERRGRYWAVYEDNDLVCITVYKRGACEVVRRLQKANP
jgi:hypothetical protein